MLLYMVDFLGNWIWTVFLILIFLIEFGLSGLNIEDITPILLFGKILIVLKIHKPNNNLFET